MELFKVENFKRAYGDTVFPRYRSLGEGETTRLRRNLGAAAGIPAGEDLLSFTKAVCARTTLCGMNASAQQFDLRSAFARLAIDPPSNVYLNWYRFDSVDEIGFADLCQFFDDIWYPATDDIDLFDSTFSWMVSINHDGEVSVAKF